VAVLLAFDHFPPDQRKVSISKAEPRPVMYLPFSLGTIVVVVLVLWLLGVV
jgi:hypothetical protein